jgi:hypothetical protein
MSQPTQEDVIKFLGKAGAFGDGAAEHIETHISHLFLSGDRAWKLKKAVAFNFLDFSAAENRREACERELELNRRTAPSLYLAVVPVTWNGHDLSIGGEGEPVDWLVEMRRFDQHTLFNVLARNGDLNRTLAGELVERVVAFHRDAERRPDHGGSQALRHNARDVGDNLRRYGDGLLDPKAVDSWCRRIDLALAAHAGLLDSRRESGFVRHCHGDMHLANICLVDGEPTLFDCIEFSDDIACIDVLFDLAFLLMDLVFHGQTGIANFVLNRYLSATEDFAGLPPMPALLSLRAAIRAMAAAIESDSDWSEARDRDARLHFDLAVRLLERPSPCLVAVGGLSGTGKSTLASTLAVRLAPGVGAVVVSSDVIRKRLFDKCPEDALPPEAYEADVSERVYERLFEDVSAALHAGQPVIADATWLRPEDRRTIAALAPEGVRFTGIWLDAPSEVLRKRIEGRTKDPSDATAEVLARQLTQNIGIVDWTRLDADMPGLVTESLLAISA